MTNYFFSVAIVGCMLCMLGDAFISGRPKLNAEKLCAGCNSSGGCSKAMVTCSEGRNDRHDCGFRPCVFWGFTGLDGSCFRFGRGTQDKFGCCVVWTSVWIFPTILGSVLQCPQQYRVWGVCTTLTSSSSVVSNIAAKGAVGELSTC